MPGSNVKFDLSLRVLPHSQSWWKTKLKTFGRWIDDVRRELHHRRDTALVTSLDDRLLSDIGLSRGSIERCLRSGAANDNWCPNPPSRSVSSTGPTAERRR